MTDNENKQAPEAQEKAADTGSQDATAELKVLVQSVKAEREGAQRARMTTAVVFIILIAVVAGYTFFLKRVVAEFIKPKNIINMGVMFAEGALAEALGTENTDTAWEVTLPKFVEQQTADISASILSSLKDPENAEALREKVQNVIQAGASNAVAMFGNQAIPQLREMSLGRIEAEIDGVLDTHAEELDAVVAKILEEHKENIGELSSDEALQKSIGDAFEERMGGYLDHATLKISRHVSAVKDSMLDLVNTAPEELTEEQKLEILVIQLMHEQFSKVSTKEIEEAAGL